MRNVLIAFGVVFATFELAVFASAVKQPHNLGYVSFSVSSGTVTEINASTPTSVGMIRYCTNCGANGGSGTLCISTGTTASNSYVLSTGTICK